MVVGKRHQEQQDGLEIPHEIRVSLITTRRIKILRNEVGRVSWRLFWWRLPVARRPVLSLSCLFDFVVPKIEALGKQLRLSVLPLCFLLGACSSNLEDMPIVTIDAP
jgi:hypothetical protein